ncbi:hypothetical protein OH492_20360 [Vibrio chagasii]|nr:hypothetical protein [Vibrio chagasii]
MKEHIDGVPSDNTESALTSEFTSSDSRTAEAGSTRQMLLNWARCFVVIRTSNWGRRDNGESCYLIGSVGAGQPS